MKIRQTTDLEGDLLDIHFSAEKFFRGVVIGECDLLGEKYVVAQNPETFSQGKRKGKLRQGQTLIPCRSILYIQKINS
jgi:hypothetical protein